MPDEAKVLRLTPRQSARRHNILASVRDQLSRFGYEGVNMRSIAESANVSPTTLYNLYDSKDALVLAALDEHLSDLNEEIDSSSTEGLARLKLRAEVSAKGIMSNPRYAEAMIRVMFNADARAPISIYLFDRLVDGLTTDIATMQVLGEVRQDVDIPLLARTIMANNWTTLLMWSKGYIALLDLPEELVRSHIATVFPVMTNTVRGTWEECVTG